MGATVVCLDHMRNVCTTSYSEETAAAVNLGYPSTLLGGKKLVSSSTFLEKIRHRPPTIAGKWPPPLLISPGLIVLGRGFLNILKSLISGLHHQLCESCSLIRRTST